MIEFLFVFVGEDAQDAPLISVRNLTPLGASQIVAAVRPLSLGSGSAVDLSELSAFASENIGKFSARVGSRDSGLRSVPGTENDFECALTPSTWDEVVGLLEPFTTATEDSESHAHAYLSQHGPIARLISTDSAF